ncbi:MAG: Rpn family recombination-promoting nuclease/putative transposase [Bacteroidales bacterium]|jgi:predicted transposase/invertase (TIGR01784 family)|nr:Rpn family recombination-promoting nuclease/putative transposase [Bacteroidales bacterium]
MPHYLDPKNDYAFKRIFGEHKHLCISLLNSLLPLEEPNRIVSIEYLLPEHAPRTPLGKDSIVDVKCVDASGRRFIVEMQMYWSTAFTKRMVFNAAQALVKQADKAAPGERSKTFSSLQPVYTLAIVNSKFPYKDEERWMYIYQVADIENPSRVLEGLNFVVVDLETDDLVRKIRSRQGWTVEKKRMAVLWLRFLKETSYYGVLDRELAEDDTIRMAAEICEEGAFTREELEVYDAYWDHIRIDLTLEEYEERDKERLKALEDKDKALEDKDRLIEELKKQLTARSL